MNKLKTNFKGSKTVATSGSLNHCQLWLACKDQTEATKIANTLLVKQLIACARQLPVKSDFRWKSKIESSNEVLLMMESRPVLFDQIEAEIARLHSYDTFVLTMTPVKKVSKKTEGWLANELAGNV
jgi:periplasmic divalent cation tolerance protein